MQDQDCINAAIRVLKEEAQGILDLVPHVGEEFARACRLILGCRGKVILTGVGKSGHIATKIASSLASTGTQSFFVESAEAAHGDLGMIGHGDVVIAVSNSGESSELRTMIASLRLRRIPLIAICGNPHSSLGEAADIFLNAHVEKEACPLNLAPTTSSTAELRFNVVSGLSPNLFDISCTDNPARTSTTFIITHDRSGSSLDVEIEVFDVSGRPLWHHVETSVPASDTYTVDWNLTGDDGCRLQAGVYVYRVRISSDGSGEVMKARKMVILGS